MSTHESQLNPATVLAKTGKPWEDWVKLLDEYDCKAKGHKATANWLYEEQKVTYWWAQTLTVEYERLRGIREVGQRSGGSFAVNVSRTMPVAQEIAWKAFAEDMHLWFTETHQQDFQVGGAYSNDDGDKGTFKRIEPKSRIQMTWDNEKYYPGSLVVIQFMAKDEKRTTVAVTHDKLPDKAAVEAMKEGWNWALDNLKQWLETGQRISFEEWRAARGAK